MSGNVWIYIGVMAVVSYLIRVLPLLLMRKQIKNTFIKSFLYYVPYVTLSVMTFPAIMDATASPYAGIAALIIGIVMAYCKRSLLQVAVTCCAVVFILELFLV
ncbi:MAG: AzlD domain-containing protein [Clostridia bacterium]|nr:AzlD domain-containing protein [Clostridia bacterium]